MTAGIIFYAYVTHSGILVVLVAYLAGKLVAGIWTNLDGFGAAEPDAREKLVEGFIQVAAAIQRTGKICSQHQSERNDQHGRAGQRIALGRMVV